MSPLPPAMKPIIPVTNAAILCIWNQSVQRRLGDGGIIARSRRHTPSLEHHRPIVSQSQLSIMTLQLILSHQCHKNLPKMTETENLNMYFDFLVKSLSHPPTWRRQSATRRQSRRFELGELSRRPSLQSMGPTKNMLFQTLDRVVLLPSNFHAICIDLPFTSARRDGRLETADVHSYCLAAFNIHDTLISNDSVSGHNQ